MEGSGGADCGAGPAVGAALLFPSYLLIGTAYLDALALDILQPFFKVFPSALEFENHDSFSPGKDIRMQNGKGEFIVAGEVADYGVGSGLFGKF